MGHEYLCAMCKKRHVFGKGVNKATDAMLDVLSALFNLSGFKGFVLCRQENGVGEIPADAWGRVAMPE